MSKPIEWKSVKRKVLELKPYDKNPRDITEQGLNELNRSISKFGLAEPIVISTENIIIGGHARWQTLKQLNVKECNCYLPNRKLNDKEVEELNKKRKFKFCNCKKCNLIFLHLGNGKRVKKYCSQECFSLYMQKERYCEGCGLKLIYNKENKRTNKKFCSKECSTHYREQGITDEHKKNISLGKKGVKLSDKHRESLSLVKKGKPIIHLITHKEEISNKISLALRGKPQPWNRGENHPRYIDGGKAQWQRQKAMGRVEYKEWRRKIFERDNYTCQICGEKGKRLNADHILSWKDYPDLRYDLDNGRTLCVKCHKNTSNYGGRKSA